MDFSVNLERKSDCYRRKLKYSKGLKRLSIISKLVLAVTIGFAVTYCTLNFLIPDWSVVSVQCVPEKDVAAIIANTVAVIMFGGITFLSLHVAFKALWGIEFARGDETLRIEGKMLEYDFKVKGMPVNEWAYVRMDLQGMKAEYDADTGKIVFKGTVVYWESHPGRRTVSSERPDFIIYDYFEPSLAETLRKENVSVDGMTPI